MPCGGVLLLHFSHPCQKPEMLQERAGKLLQVHLSLTHALEDTWAGDGGAVCPTDQKLLHTVPAWDLAGVTRSSSEPHTLHRNAFFKLFEHG